MRSRQARLRERLTSELPNTRASWFGVAMYRAVRILLRAGGIDLAGSLAYFTVLSIFPATALVVMVMNALGHPKFIETQLTEVLVFYFPRSQGLIHEAFEQLLHGSLSIGLVAFVGMVMGANGLFMAANRSMNRIFGVDTQRILSITVIQVTFATALVLLFLLSLGISAFLQQAVSYSEDVVGSVEVLSGIGGFMLAAASALLPAFFIMLVFAFVYFRMPNVNVKWRDALFGAAVAIVLFEVGKYAFFWFTALAGQRNVVYGPIASFVLLLMWAYVAGMIFLYGAALTRAVSELRPSKSPAWRGRR